jgi:hypothetical protein
VAVSANGRAVAAWLQLDGSLYDVWSSAYTPGAGWGRAALVDPVRHGIGWPIEVDVAVDTEGNALAAWRVTDEHLFGTRHLWSARFE